MSIEVRVDPNEPIENAMKKFKKLVDREGILQNFRDRERFMKPSAKKHLAQIELKRKMRKINRKIKEQEEKDISNKLIPML